MKKLMPLLYIVLLTSGCATTPTGDIGAFGEATKGITDKIDSVITEYNDATIQKNISELAAHSRPITIDSLSPIDSAVITDTEKKSYALYKANKALSAYATSLTALANAGSRDDIDLAATKLYGALHNFNEQYKVLESTNSNLITDKDSALIGSVVAALGNIYVERERAKALKTIITTADQSIQTICDDIKKELLKGTIEERLHTIRRTDLAGYVDDYNKIVATANYANKKKSVEELYDKYRIMQLSTASVLAAIDAIDSIKKAHSTINKELRENKFTSKEIVAEIGRLKEMKDHYNSLDEMMLNCHKQIVSDPTKGLICK